MVGPDRQTAAILALLLGCAEPQPIAESLAARLKGVVAVDDHADEVDYRIFAFAPAQHLGVALDPEVCWSIGLAAEEACDEVTGAEGDCSANATFGWIGTLPRCVLHLWRSLATDWTEPPELWAMDIDGRLQEPGHCGNGRLDPGELCDDGNNEDFDGCDPACQPGGFGGCELIIFQEFYLADIAYVAEDRWTMVGTQTMVNRSARLLGPLDVDTCSRASVAADTACRRIGWEVPQVAHCNAITYPIDDDTCSIRLSIWLEPDPNEVSTFPASLPVLLGFTLRN